ncbi:protein DETOXIFICATION 45, chloroplastic-like [Alnus glutinosa]|uniref:protein DETOXIFICATION 45, chloroplastic-like n=1 Tax=Alnus glutinosa TaxID=3517 RepID=UPI002D784524|nr:protein DETOXIFICATION 45, chloroplastic-like [Alnus glutinosa]XP_062177308.1 protein DETOXIFICATION 45, chloroplastic-like [Alnus glutinosa]XP_062177309.1 protein DETOXIFICATION 45, chloroplastic-like [Alnus glutinosa]XP_062177310.1 protein DETOXIFICATION 45, chloroplastic-like [Alnus glutinosa]
MSVTRLSGSLACDIKVKRCERRSVKNVTIKYWSKTSRKVGHDHCFVVGDPRGLSSINVARRCGLISEQQTSDYELSASSERIFELAGTPTTSESRPPSVQTELIMLSLPAIAGQAIEPLAQLMETAYIGRLGPLELASAGLSMSIFNIISKVFNIPLLSVATSFVAEDIARNGSKGSNSGLDGMDERKLLPSVSTALLLALGIGTVEALAMYLGSGVFLNMMGISSASSMRIPAEQFLSLRAIGAPAVVVSLAIQGIFRGFKDTKTPVLCLGIGNLAAVFLFPLLMYTFRLGVTGAAISTVVSQYIVAFLMIWYLNKKTVLSFPSMETLHFGGYLKSGGFLLGRTLAAVLTITLSTSMAARLGPLAMAAHQICLQVWLSVSLLADAQASAGQALIASSFAKGDYGTVKEITYFALKTGLFTGISLAIILGVSFGSLATLFTNDSEVLGIVRSGLLFVSASQPINALAYIFDGLHYGISDFSYAAYSMMAVGAISSAFLLYAPSVIGLSGVWSGLTLFMGLRTVTGYMRLLSKNGPWWFLQEDIQSTNLRLPSEMKTVRPNLI